MSTENSTDAKTIKQDCINCLNHTNHQVLGHAEHSDENEHVSYWSAYLIIKCMGCDHTYFRVESRFSEDWDYDGYGDMYIPTRVRCYPDPEVRIEGLYLRDDVKSIPSIIQSIYRETITAIQKRLPTLAGIGVRAILEATCKDQKTSGRNLATQIDNLVKQGLLTESGAKILHGIRHLGNDAAHEIKAPTEKQAIAAMKVIDHLLLGAYILPEEAKILPEHKKKEKPSPNAATALSPRKKAKGASK